MFVNSRLLQLLASLMKRFSLSADDEYELLYLEDNGARTPLDPTNLVLRYANLRTREGKLVLKRLRRELRVRVAHSLPTSEFLG